MNNERGEKFAGPGLEPGSSASRTDALPAEPPVQFSPHSLFFFKKNVLIINLPVVFMLL